MAGYKVYYGTASGIYGTPINVGNVTTYTLTGLTNGQSYFITITAYDTSGQESDYSNEVSGTANDSESVITPNVLSGPTSGTTGTSYTYTTGGSTSNLGHSVQYQFDWKGDGTDLSAWGSATQSKTWTAAGTYNVRSRARCSTHTTVVSNWSPYLTVTISPASQSYTVTTNPTGRQVTVDSVNYTAPQTFSWTPGSTHSLSVGSPQSGSTGTRYTYSSWSDGGTQTHNVTVPSSSKTYTANFTTQYGLTTSANPSAGGTVSPSGTNWYKSALSVSVSAKANAGYTFSNWSGDLSGSTNPTSISMNGPKNVVANFSAIPPPPNSMTWVTVPHETGTNSISMVASTVTDPTPPISYYFDFVGSPTAGLGGKDSGWQAGTSYTNSNLQANHKYGYRVKAKDGLNNQTAYSTTQYAYTAVQPPTGIIFGTITPTSIQSRSTNTQTGLSWGSSGLWIENTTNTTNSGWKRNNIHWTSKDLSPNAKYTFQAKARNGGGIETGYGPSASKYTRANLPGRASFSDVTRTSIRANWTPNGNPSGTQYLCQNVTTGANSGWITETSWNSDNLTCGISHSFRVKAKNGDGVETGWTSLGSQSSVKCIILLKPNGGETIPSGSNYDIQWDPAPEAVSFDLFYSLDNGVSWPLIKKDERNTIYSWPVPKTIGNKKACFVRVIGYNAARTKKIGSDTSDKPLTIEVVKLTSPNGGGAPLKQNGIIHITWTAYKTSQPVTKVQLYYTKDGGVTYYLITTLTGTYPPGTYTRHWTIPPVGTTPKTKCKVKVVLSDATGVARGSDVSDSYFTIEP